MIDLIYSQFLGTTHGSNFPNLCSSCPEHLGHLPYCIIRCSIEPATVQTSPICKPRCHCLHRDSSSACTVIHRSWSSVCSNCLTQRYCSRHWGYRGFWGCGETTLFFRFVQCYLCQTLLNSFVPLRAHHNEFRELLRHIILSEAVVHILEGCHAQGVLERERIPNMVSNEVMNSTIILRKLAVLLFDLVDFPLCCHQPVRDPKSCFQEFYKSW